MSRPRELWWAYAKNVIRAYPELHRRASRERLSPQERRHHEAVQRAIERTNKKKNARERMELVRLVYWDKTHTVAGAGLLIGYEYTQARQMNGQFIREVAEELGLGENPAPRAKKK